MKSNSCKAPTDDDDLDLSCEFVKKDAEPWCKWNTGEKCSCNDCENNSLPKLVALFIYIFHLMDNDCLVQTSSPQKNSKFQKFQKLKFEKSKFSRFFLFQICPTPSNYPFIPTISIP